jgi:hypothetical protein
VFLGPSARALIPAWKDRARRLLAEFRADFAHTFRDAQVKAFVETLRGESPFFAEAWDEQAVQIREGGLRLFNHPHNGLVSFTQHSFAPTERPGHKLVILTRAADAGPRQAGLERFAVGPSCAASNTFWQCIAFEARN